MKRKMIAALIGTALLCGATGTAMAANTTDLLKEYQIVFEDDILFTQKAVVKDGVIMIPMRAVAETLGCEVSWNEETQEATMQNDKRIMTVQLGKDLYVSAVAPGGQGVGMTAPTELGCAPYIDEEYRTWIPAKAFEVMVGYTVTVDEAGHSIHIK